MLRQVVERQAKRLRLLRDAVVQFRGIVLGGDERHTRTLHVAFEER